ncbi:MAG: c-type cytochrome [Candidatus Melainabacteria bacterium]|nr:c-type cytochrome [Candidatus Melainabacteria bacterium]
MSKKLSILKKMFLLILLLNLLIGLAKGASAENSLKGERLFKANCSGCHLNGQNLIRPEKPIIGSLKLQSKKTFKAFIENPPPPMPKFKNIADKPVQLDALYKYVTSLKGQ